MDGKIFAAIVLLAAGTLLIKYGLNLRDCTKYFVSDLKGMTKITSFIFGSMFAFLGYKSAGSINISVIIVCTTLFIYWHIKKYIEHRI